MIDVHPLVILLLRYFTSNMIFSNSGHVFFIAKP